MAAERVSKKEIDYIFMIAAIALVLAFIVDPLKQMLVAIFPNPLTQVSIGIILLLIAAYYFNIKR